MKPFAQSRSTGFLCGLLVAVAAVGAPTAVWAQDGAVQSFDIPAQDARRALVDLCLSAGCELAFVAPLGRALQSHGVRGRMGWRAAVSEMLRDTPLRYRFVGARGLRVWVEPVRTASVAPVVVEPA
ncbi:STN domain-containing protein, partial [Brevundimonas sp.]|uniref:STN domain-containing protein n=1 Tax=Brevundimonas sp. TaxID=1871086 RepID=UPI0025C63ACA